MQIIRKKIGDLKPSKYNPRKDLKSGSPAYNRLKKSIENFDYIEPIVWNKRTDRIVGGHQRIKILAELGYMVVDVSVVDLSEEKEKALNLALNKTGGNWDLKKLEVVFEDLKLTDLDFEMTGFSDIEVNQLGRYMNEDQDGSPQLGDLEYQIIINCENENHQIRLLKKFNKEKIKCRPLIL